MILTALYWGLVALFAGRVIVTSRWFTGLRGEWRLRFWVKLLLSRDYLLFNDITLPTARGSAQIDHIIVSRYGVFVIETKNLKGWIFGDKDGNQWTQKLYQRTHRFYNPIKQNEKHLDVLQKILDLPDNQLFSLVVFVGDCEFKTEMPDNVVSGLAFIRFIKKRKKRILSAKQVYEICKTLKNKRLRPSLKTWFLHIRHAKKQRKKALKRKA